MCRWEEWQAAIRSAASTHGTNRRRGSNSNIEEIALGYQQALGKPSQPRNTAIAATIRSQPSSAFRTFDNLEVKPHPFSEGDTLNKVSDADLTAIITYGGSALNKSALMPAWGNTLSKSDTQALILLHPRRIRSASRAAAPVYKSNDSQRPD